MERSGCLRVTPGVCRPECQSDVTKILRCLDAIKQTRADATGSRTMQDIYRGRLALVGQTDQGDGRVPPAHTFRNDLTADPAEAKDKQSAIRKVHPAKGAQCQRPHAAHTLVWVRGGCGVL